MANILAYSFGEEGVDRYIMIFKKEHAPSEDQLNTLRKGEEWNEEVRLMLPRRSIRTLEKEGKGVFIQSNDNEIWITTSVPRHMSLEKGRKKKRKVEKTQFTKN